MDIVLVKNREICPICTLIDVSVYVYFCFSASYCILRIFVLYCYTAHTALSIIDTIVILTSTIALTSTYYFNQNLRIMKTQKLIVLLVFMAGLSIQFSHAQNFSAEEQAVINVVEGDADAWFSRNYETWKEFWIHDDMTRHIVANKFYHHILNGWEEVNEFMGGNFQTYPNPIPQGDKKNYLIRMSGDLANVSDDAYPASNEGTNNLGPNKEFYTLVKKDGKWKITQYMSMNPGSYSVENIEWSLNGDGYTLLQAGKVDEAIKVFKLNTELYPESGNVWDSLGEGYMVAGKTELAIKNYEKSLDIDPSNTNAVEMLKKLKKEM